MPCDPIYGPDRRPMGIVCTRGPRGRKKPCRDCKAPSAFLCDGCDAPICPRCAVSVRALDTDFCRPCSRQNAPGCLVPSFAVPVPCTGPIVKKDGVCLAHDLVFTWWLRAGKGWETVYSRQDLSQSDKRRHFVTWLRANGAQARALIHSAIGAAP